MVGKFVEFFGPGVTHLSIADRATIANMCPEYGATVGFFPVDEKTLLYLRQTGQYASKENKVVSWCCRCVQSRNDVLQLISPRYIALQYDF